jgi:pyruvate-formate lyase-activating enzyme
MGLRRTITRLVQAHDGLAGALRGLTRLPVITRFPPLKRLVLRRVERMDAGIAAVRPWIVIETALTCNARCLMCVHSQRDMRGEMSLELYEKLIREVADWKIPFVTLVGYGEPLADRQWLRRIEILRAAGINYGFVTNGSLLKPEVVSRMLELGGWERVAFSINGFSPEVYEQMMPPLKRDTVYRNVEAFLETKQRLGLALPAVRISCIQTSANAHERGQFLRYWSAKPGVERVHMAPCSTWLGELDDKDLAFSGAERHAARGAWMAPCISAWSMMQVLYDGRVLPCCEDCAGRRLVIGDANRNTLREIFLGGPASRLRELHKADQRHRHPVCGKCQIGPAAAWLT